jgi:predicted ATPase
LFVEELTKSILESGSISKQVSDGEIGSSWTELAIPETLQDSLRARLDRLSPVKRVIELCATLGREFSMRCLMPSRLWKSKNSSKDLLA